MWWRCVHLNGITVVVRIDVVVQADCFRRTLIEFRLSQFVADICVFFFIFKKLGQFKVDFGAALIFETRSLCAFESFQERFCRDNRD